MIDLNDVLLAMSNIPVDDPIAEIWGRGLQGGYKIIEYTGSLPITINANGDALIDYRIYGADGGVGDRVDIAGLSEPLCGIQTYTDSLDLSTGILTRRIKKLVLTGEEVISSVTKSTLDPEAYCFAYHYINLGMRDIIDYGKPMTTIPYPRYVCSHFEMKPSPAQQYDDFTNIRDGQVGANAIFTDTFNRYIIFCSSQYTTISDFNSYLAAQYAAGTPVTVWYVLKNADVSTISIPPGLTGTIEGYLIQDGTPTPETPIYPIANGVKQSDGTYSISIKYYKLPMTVSDGNTAQTVPIYIDENRLDAGEYVSYSDGKIYKRTENLFEINRERSDVFTLDPKYYLYGGIADIKNVDASTVSIELTDNLKVSSPSTSAHGAGFIVPVLPNTTYTLSYDIDVLVANNKTSAALNFIDNTGNLKTFWGIYGSSTINTFTTTSTAKYVYIVFRIVGRTATYSNIMLVEGSTTPTAYIPYVRPTDPPVSLSEIPTVNGETVIDYDGEPRPSQMYVKYKSKG